LVNTASLLDVQHLKGIV